MWVDLKNWCDYERNQLIAYEDANTILMYPGSEYGHFIIDVSDAILLKWVRIEEK